MPSFLHLDLIGLIKALGYVGLFAIVFAESGLFFGFFLPGDSLLLTAGLLASQGLLNIWALVIILASGAILGDSVGYWFGSKFGPKIFSREHSFFFNKKHIERTRLFYEKYGPRAVMLARFVPIVRTFIPILAGVGNMRYGAFLRYNIIGGSFWSAGVALAGYFLGNALPNIDNYLLPIIILIVLISFLPILFEFKKAKRENGDRS